MFTANLKKYNTNIYKFIDDYNHNVNDYFFSHDTLKAFGDNISQMSILKTIESIEDDCGKLHACFVLSHKVKNFEGKRVRVYDYFDTTTLERVLPSKGV